MAARPPHHGRAHAPTLEARLHALGDGRFELRAPGVGLLRDVPLPGELVVPGVPVGALEVAGVLHEVLAPAGARGVVVGDVRPGYAARRPVGWDAPFALLDPEAAGEAVAADAAADAAAEARGLVFTAPSSGRFYGRPAPDQPAFVQEGDVLTVGQTVALLEVMKTFNRVTYGGPGLPERARVLRVVPADESDLDQGDPILELEPA